MLPINIAVVGGSIAGCTAAIALARDGHQVTVFERSRQPLEDRGAGIVIPTTLLDHLKQLDMLDADMPAVQLSAMDYRVRSEREPGGRMLWQRPLAASALRWGHLYQQLRQRIADENYLQGIEVVDVQQDSLTETGPGETEQVTAVTLLLGNGQKRRFDLVIASDGVYSRARAKLSPGALPRYAGYVLWRGLLDASEELRQTTPDRILWHPYQGGLAGHYCIARPDYSDQKRRYTINWGIYDMIDTDVLQRLLPGFEVTQATPCALSDAARKHLDGLLAAQIPTAMGEWIKSTEAPFVQPIIDVAATHLVDRRLVLIGDAAAVLRPHSASGAVKAIQNGLSLSQAIHRDSSIESALQDWQSTHLAELQQQISLSNALGRGWITEAPDWQQMDEQKMGAWWDNMVSGNNWYISTTGKK